MHIYCEANFGNLLLVVIPAVCEEEDGNQFGLAKAVCTGRGLSYASFSMAVITTIYTSSFILSLTLIISLPASGCRRLISVPERLGSIIRFGNIDTFDLGA